ncbi:hypothetical protein [Sphingomonas azotifigens]|uniref:hypothetical protein n=1 Tax=Sphingomonas azotifigens TaxID=330920 RepID=UPI00111BF5C9|nr:hypothetical protein [Sphingomonas azotifigens]
MLDGFGLAPVCIEFDLDSYEGPWTHVERFRGRSGWLVVAEAEMTSAGGGWDTTLVAACDDHLDPVPSFMAPNLLACGCSLPGECDEYPPEDLEELLADAADELKVQWLRGSNAGLAQLTEATFARIAELEGQAARRIDALEYQIADLRRRRRMPGGSDAERALLQDIIGEFEQERDAIVERLASDRARLRQRVEQEERALIAKTRVRVSVAPLYYVRWSARARRHTDWDVAREQARRMTTCFPGSRFDAGCNLDAAKIERMLSAGLAAATKPPPSLPVAAPDAAREKTVPSRRPEAEQPAPRHVAVPADHHLHELSELRQQLARVEAKAAKFFPGSRKFTKNQEEQARLRRRITQLEAAGDETVPFIAAPKRDESQVRGSNLMAERMRLAAELREHERRGARREDGSRRFIRYGERRRELMAQIANLDRRIAAPQPIAEVDL